MLFAKVLALFFVGSFVSCASKTTLPFSTDAKNAWFLESNGVSQYPTYCMANEKDSGADPVCYKAKKVDLTTTSSSLLR